MRRIALILSLLASGAAGLAASAGADDTSTYEIEMYNAFGIVTGSDVRISGVNAGSVQDLEITPDKTAIVTVELNGDLATLGEDTTCSAEPQSLIAEYFITCVPKGPPLAEDDDSDNPDPDIPAERVQMTVQPDLVTNTLREPYKRRLQILINEFGTGLAGNPEELNAAIRAGAPALTETRKITRILADQNEIIRDLNADSDTVIGELARVRQDVVEFVDETEDTAAASAARRDDLSRDFELLDDFLAELNPTLVGLEELATQQTPLLSDLNSAAPGLNRLAGNLPGFNAATETSLTTLGDASLVGRKALKRGRDEIGLLADAGRRLPITAEALADFFRDIDDPRRAVEIDDRAATDTGRTNPKPGKKDTKGYTGMEALLNWLYYLVGTSSQYDQVGHTMHINLYGFETGPCGHVSSGRNEETGEPGVPTDEGGTTTDILEAARCVQWMGPNQPGISEEFDLPPYDPRVCPNGTEPEAARDLCNPVAARTQPRAGGTSPARGTGGRGGETGAGPSGTGAGSLPDAEPSSGGNILDQILDVPRSALEGLPEQLQDELRGLGDNLRGLGRGDQRASGSGAALDGALGGAQDLLDFLFSN